MGEVSRNDDAALSLMVKSVGYRFNTVFDVCGGHLEIADFEGLTALQVPDLNITQRIFTDVLPA